MSEMRVGVYERRVEGWKREWCFVWTGQQRRAPGQSGDAAGGGAVICAHRDDCERRLRRRDDVRRILCRCHLCKSVWPQRAYRGFRRSPLRWFGKLLGSSFPAERDWGSTRGGAGGVRTWHRARWSGEEGGVEDSREGSLGGNSGARRPVGGFGAGFWRAASELNNVRPVEGWRARLAARGAVAEAGRRASSFSSATDLWCEACPTRPAHPPRFPCPYAERDVGLLYRLDGGREASSSASGAAAIRMLNKAQTGHRH